MPDYDLPDIGLGKLEDLQESLNQTPQNIDVSLELEYNKPVGPQVRLPEIGLDKLEAIQDDVEAIQARDYFTGPGSVSVSSSAVPPVSPDIDYTKLAAAGIGAVRDVAIAAIRPQPPAVRIPMPVPAPASARPAAPAVQPQPAGGMPTAQGPGPVLQGPPLEAPPLQPPAEGPPPVAGGSGSKVALAVGGTAAAAGVLALIYAAVKRGS